MKTILLRMSLVMMLAVSAVPAQSFSSPTGDEVSGVGRHQTPTHYTVTDLGPVGGPPGQPIAIRNNGFIGGSAAVADTTWHAFLWYKGLKFDIGKRGLGGPSNIAFSVNDWGQAVGQAETRHPDPNGEDFCGFASQLGCAPFLWQNGVMSRLPALVHKNEDGGTNAAANAINNQGLIAGVAENGERDSTCPDFDPTLRQYQKFQFKPTLWENGKPRELPTIGNDPDGIALALNDKGQAVGASGSCTGYQINGDLTYLFGLHATLWQNGKVIDLGNLGGIASGGGNVATGINNRSQAVGSSGTVDGSFHAFVWDKDAGIQDLGTIPEDVASVALGINDQGDVVGISFNTNFEPRAFIRHDGGVPVDLNSMIAPDSPLVLFDACSINARGEIIGIATNTAGEAHAYLAIPSKGF